MARKKKEKASQDEAEKMLETGEAEIPVEAIVNEPESSSVNSDIEKHPKFSKFKSRGK